MWFGSACLREGRELGLVLNAVWVCLFAGRACEGFLDSVDLLRGISDFWIAVCLEFTKGCHPREGGDPGVL